MYKKIKRKKLYATGGFIEDNQDAIGMGAGMVGDFLQQQGEAGTVIGGAAKGIGMGASLGPVGMVAGGALGLLGGVLGLGQQRKQERIAKQQKDNAIKTGIANRSRVNLADFDTYGDTQEYYANGGEINQDPKPKKKGVVKSYTKPTSRDSLNLYNNSKKVMNYYKSKGYKEGGLNKEEYEDMPLSYWENLDIADKVIHTPEMRPTIKVPLKNGKRANVNPAGLKTKEQIDENRFLQTADYESFMIDTRAPKSLFDKRIKPSQTKSLINKNKEDIMYGNEVVLPIYDETIKPKGPTSKKSIVKPYNKPKAKTIDNSIPNDLEWTDIEQPVQLNEVNITKKLAPATYPFGKRGETMTKDEWEYTRKKRGYPNVYDDRGQLRGTDNFIPGESFSNEIRNDIKEYRSKKKLALGGPTPEAYEVEEGEVVQGNAVLEEGTQLSDDMHLVGGDSHEDGGTQGIGGERVFSDRMKMNKEVIETLQKLGLPLKGQVTYAEAAKIIGKKKAKAEEKIDSKMAPVIKTGRRMLEDHDNALDIIFNIQEMMKPQTAVVKKYAVGGILPKSNVRPLNINVPEVTGNFNYATGLGSSTPVPAPIAQPNNWWEQNSGQLINAANFGLNTLAINNLDTTVKRDYINTPRYSYKDRSSVARRNNNNAYRNTVDSLSSSSAGVTGSNAGALYGATLQANSEINNQENMRRDRYDDNFSDKTMRVEAMNAGIAAEANDMSRDLTNNKRVALPTQARNAFLQGYAGNTAMSQRANLEKQKMIISAYLNNDRGVLSRIGANDIKNVQELPIFKMFNQ